MDKLSEQLIKLGETDPDLRDHLRPILDHVGREAGGQFPWSQPARSKSRGPMTDVYALGKLGEALERGSRGALKMGGGLKGHPYVFLSLKEDYVPRFFKQDVQVEYAVELGNDGYVEVEITVFDLSNMYADDFSDKPLFELKRKDRIDVSALPDDTDESEVAALTPVVLKLIELLNKDAARLLK